MKFFLLFLSFVIFLISCDTEPADITAKLMTIEEIKKTPGFDWFQTYYDIYIPNQNIVDSIKTTFNPQIHKLIIYARPVCSSCDTTMKPFPQLIKTLHLANIPDSTFQIYSCRTLSSPHPYKDIFTIRTLPSAFLMKDNSAKYSVIDTLNYYRTINPNGSYSVEQFLLTALKRN